MSINVLVIGIGTGNLEQLTHEAVRALNRVDVFLVADKGAAKDDLVGLRQEICRAYIADQSYRLIEVPDPERGADAGRGSAEYLSAVEQWHQLRAQRYADVIRAEVGDHGTVGLLAWGDPAFYDSTIRIVERIRQTGLDLDLTVIPGISSLQVLAARHRIALNRIGRPIHITTGRRLVDEFRPELGDVAVMLDADLACGALSSAHPELQIFWGAQLGLPDEALLSGRLPEVMEELRHTRASIRARRGWVMDTYLLRPQVAAAT